MNKERIVISGVNGFVGHHLSRQLHNEGLSVIGVGHDSEVAMEIKDIIDEYHSADLTQQWPDIPNVKAVIHLAGLAAVGPSFDNPQRYINSNSSMVTNLCEYYMTQNEKPRVVIVSSGAVYDSNQPMPISEDGNVGFSSPYAVSKVLTENQATYYRARGLDCVIARPFNHIGPGQAEGFILPDFYSRLLSLEDSNSKIKVGNIETRRDYTDVRDIVKAYGKIALTPTLQHNMYNICSGKSLSGGEIFNKLANAMNMPHATYEIDSSLVRPTDIAEIVGDSHRLRTELGWKLDFTIDQTISDFVKNKTI